MANVNSSNGWVSLPAQAVTGTAYTTLVVPPSSASYQGLPSPTFAAGAGLYINLSNTTNTNNPTAASPTYTNDAIDGRQFRVRVVGIATLSASSTLQVALFNGSSSTTTSDTLISLSASYTVTTASTVNFIFENNLIWDSTSQKLNGWFFSDVNNTFTGAAAITSVASLSVTNLQFIPAIILGTANAGNVWAVKEFLYENV